MRASPSVYLRMGVYRCEPREARLSKLTIRYFIDGAQVDEQVLEEDRPETDLRALIEASKHGISECVSDIESEFRVGPSLLEALQRIGPGMASRRIEEIDRKK